MKQFHIHHSKSLLPLEIDIQPREYAGFVEAESLDEAYSKSQNFSGPWNPTNPCRSTSVGDIIQDDDKFYMVCGIGFKLLGEPEPDNIDKLVNESLAQTVLDNYFELQGDMANQFNDSQNEDYEDYMNEVDPD